MKVLKEVVRLTAVVLFTVVGSGVWSSRLANESDRQLRQLEAKGLQLVASDVPFDISSACNARKSAGGWVAFVFSLQLLSDTNFRRYFETDSGDRGIFIEYDGREAANLRLGYSTQSKVNLIRLRTVRKDESALLTVGVNADEIRWVVNGSADQVSVVEYQTGSGLDLSCESVTNLGDRSGQCDNCQSQFGYIAGSGKVSFENLFRQLSTTREYQFRRWIGIGMTLMGIVLASRRFTIRTLWKRVVP